MEVGQVATRSFEARFEGLVEVVKPGYILVQPEKGPVILSKTTILNGANLKEK